MNLLGQRLPRSRGKNTSILVKDELLRLITQIETLDSHWLSVLRNEVAHLWLDEGEGGSKEFLHAALRLITQEIIEEYDEVPEEYDEPRGVWLGTVDQIDMWWSKFNSDIHRYSQTCTLDCDGPCSIIKLAEFPGIIEGFGNWGKRRSWHDESIVEAVLRCIAIVPDVNDRLRERRVLRTAQMARENLLFGKLDN